MENDKKYLFELLDDTDIMLLEETSAYGFKKLELNLDNAIEEFAENEYR